MSLTDLSCSEDDVLPDKIHLPTHLRDLLRTKNRRNFHHQAKKELGGDFIFAPLRIDAFKKKCVRETIKEEKTNSDDRFLACIHSLDIIWHMFLDLGRAKMSPPPPLVKWAQREELVFLTICLEDCKDPIIDINEDNLRFEAVGGSEKKSYSFRIKLFKAINKEVIEA